MKYKGFEGWYFKHQKDNQIIAFIPGRAASGAFVQVIDQTGSHHFPIEKLRAKGDTIQADQCYFSPRGIHVELPNIQGTIKYKQLTPLAYSIMGPFEHLPMECYHGVVSMRHTLKGSLSLSGVKQSFDGGVGYIEKDRGTSFPQSYLWLQCNDFPIPCSIMVSIAHIPFGGTSFTGCICAITYGGKEYRLATYTGVRIHAQGPNYIRLSQGNRLLELDITPSKESHPLFAPREGQMSQVIREAHTAAVTCRLWEKGKLILSVQSKQASFEYVPNREMIEK